MYAVVKTGGKQYRVSADDVFRIERLPGEAGDVITLNEVLLIGDGSAVTVGAPLVEGASVAAEIVEQTRAKKIFIFKKRRRQNYRRRAGHRQLHTVLRITEILVDGAKPGKRTTPKAAEPEAGRDDISLIGGIGPKLKEKLEGYGVRTLSQLAGMSGPDVEAMDAALELRGRATREEWVLQAQELIDGKPPRAKSDRARADDAE